MKRIHLLLFLAVIFCFCTATASYAQLSLEERDIIIEEIMKRLDIEAAVEKAVNKKMEGLENQLNSDITVKFSELRGSVKAEIKAELIAEVIEETKSEIMSELSASAEQAVNQAAEEMISRNNAPAPTPAPSQQQQKSSTPKQTYTGPHATMVNSYAYKVGGDSENGAHTYKSEYYPNELFTVDVVFENDGNMNLPPNMELRHTGNNGEYTGHTESAFVYDKTIKPGDRVGFSFAAHGSENIGIITFFWQLYDADTGKAVPGGNGYFTYTAKP